MKVSELIKLLEQCNGDHEAVLTIVNDDNEITTYAIDCIDPTGWEPSGIVSIEAINGPISE